MARLAWTYLALLLLVWALAELVAERTVPTLLLAYLPPVIWVWPAPLLLLLALLRWRKGGRPAIFPAVLACLLALPVLGFTWHAPQPAWPGDLKVLTYNVARGGLGTAARISAQIRSVNADIVTLQEVNGLRPGLTAELLAGLPGYAVSRAGAEVMTLSRFPVLGTRELILPGTGRRFLVSRIGAPGGELSVVNVHFGTVTVSRVLSGQIMPTRDRRAQQLDVLLREVAATSGPVIVAGDFNTPPRGQVYRALSAELSDAWDSAGRGFGYTFSSQAPVLRIDHVFVRGLKVVGAGVQPPGGSDHRALAVQVRW
ncbi:endonuclease/exonuclease/phosphatase family protein [Deinococcus sp.]|uniref:endonuclease/exonuclease/phosphatase family protein n=1 Tax=Deinococcus sp. TaxID=47478 RepID=UPI0025DF3A35|nr:endonuclease/exonuclease/phosphatase family protein [Deinococcus sp.]